jgi:hypothetical protein
MKKVIGKTYTSFNEALMDAVHDKVLRDKVSSLNIVKIK